MVESLDPPSTAECTGDGDVDENVVNGALSAEYPRSAAPRTSPGPAVTEPLDPPATVGGADDGGGVDEVVVDLGAVGVGAQLLAYASVPADVWDSVIASSTCSKAFGKGGNALNIDDGVTCVGQFGSRTIP